MTLEEISEVVERRKRTKKKRAEAEAYEKTELFRVIRNAIFGIVAIAIVFTACYYLRQAYRQVRGLSEVEQLEENTSNYLSCLKKIKDEESAKAQIPKLLESGKEILRNLIRIMDKGDFQLYSELINREEAIGKLNWKIELELQRIRKVPALEKILSWDALDRETLTLMSELEDKVPEPFKVLRDFKGNPWGDR